MWPADSRGIRKRWRGHADSLGERLVVETALGVRVEALALAPGLIASERAGQVLRRQVHHLADISHPALRSPRDVVRLSPADDRLAVVSDYVPGQRASRWLQAGGARRLPTSTVLFIAREVASALATATEHVPGSFHGTLGLERIVLTPDKRVMVVEPGLGPALALLPRAVPADWWRRYRLAVPIAPGLDPFGPATDACQLGVFVLELLLGRLLEPEEYPDRLAVLLGEAQETDLLGRSTLLGSGLFDWLTTALGLDGAPEPPRVGHLLVRLESLLSDEGGYVALPLELDVTPEPLEPIAPNEADDATGARGGPEPSRGEDPGWTATAGPPSTGRNPGPDSVQSGLAPSAATASPFPAGAATPATGAVARDASLSPGPDGAPSAAVPADDPWPAAEEHQAIGPGALEPALASVQPPPLASASRPAPAPAAETFPAHDRPGSSYDAGLAPLQDGRWKIGHHEQAQFGEGDGADEAVYRPADRPVQPPRWRARPVVLFGPALLVCAMMGAAALWLPSAPGQPAVVKLDSRPSGAAVRVGQEARGTTPITLRLDPGSYVIELSRDGGAARVPLTVGPGEEIARVVDLRFDGPPGTIEVGTDPPGAQVTIDGKAYGASPVSVPMPPGEHVVKVHNAVAQAEQRFTLRPGERFTVLVPLAGWIDVRAPVEVDVYERGQRVGRSGSGRLLVAAGRRRLHFVNEALGVKVDTEVTVLAGAVTRVDVPLAPGLLSVEADLPSEVWLDGTLVGRTPTGAVPAAVGQHEVTVRHPRAGEQRFTVLVGLSEPTRLNVRWQLDGGPRRAAPVRRR
jgi:hypothetical protein